MAKPLSEIAAQHKDRKTAIIAAYKTDAYSQREIGEFYQLHPTTIGVIARKNNDSGPDPLCAEMKKQLWGGEFWTDDYLASTVSKLRCVKKSG